MKPFTPELSARMAVCACVYCIESGDDLGPLRFRFGGVDWVGVDGRLTGHFFFHCDPRLCRRREEEISDSWNHDTYLESEGHEHTRKEKG